MGRWTAEDVEKRRGCEFGGWMDGRVKSFFDAKSAKGSINGSWHLFCSLTMRGSPAAVRLAMEKIIVPQIPHLMREARR
jgi:hypothetical protein